MAFETTLAKSNLTYTNVSGGATTTQVTTGIGTLESIIIDNAGGSWEIDIYDGVSSSATGTSANPSVNINPNPIAKIRGATVPTTIPIHVSIVNGIFVDGVKGTTPGTIIITNY